jgi:hypothetical protein
MVKILRRDERKWRDDERTAARKDGWGAKPKKKRPAKTALNALAIPKTEPPKWYSVGHYFSYKPEAIREALFLKRKKACEYAKIVIKRTEDGTMYGIYTYPEVKW